MKLTEYRLRAALAETAREIPPGSLPPLDLSAASERAAGRAMRNVLRGLGGRRIKVLAAPIAAAAAVAAVIATPAALSGGSHDRRPVTAAQSAGLASVPPYYMARVGKVAGVSGLALRGVIRRTLSGKPVATMLLPKPYRYIRAVAGSANDRTFLVAARNTTKLRGATGFYLAQFSPAKRKVTVTFLNIPPVPAPPSMVVGLAVSPNGSQVAVAVSTKQAGGSTLTQVSVYWPGTDKVKVWKARDVGVPALKYIGYGWYDPSALSWSSNGKLAFNATTGGRPYSVWLLNTATAGGSLLADSHYVVRSGGADGLVTPTGARVVAPLARELPDGHYQGEFAVYSTATGKLIDVLYRKKGTSDTVDWTNSSGSVLIGGVMLQGHDSGTLGVVIGNRFTPLRGAPAVLGPTATISF
jgi:hypothetical protein